MYGFAVVAVGGILYNCSVQNLTQNPNYRRSKSHPNKSKGRLQKPNRRLTGASGRVRPVCIVLNNDNRPEPEGTAGQPAVGF